MNIASEHYDAGALTRYMDGAIALGDRAKGHSGSNPNVGALIVKQSQIVGRGWTGSTGRPHAEEMALTQAGDKARGATAFVTLEPCMHEGVGGQPCAARLVNAGIAQIIVAAHDPDPRTSHKSAGFFENAGVKAQYGLCAARAQYSMAGFFTRMTKGRPFTRLKLAQSLDGRIADAYGESQWISGTKSRQYGHIWRAQSDAILVGGNSFRLDNPRLDCRIAGLSARSPQRVVLSRRDMHDIRDAHNIGNIGNIHGQRGKEGRPWRQIRKPEDISALDDVNWLLIEGGAQTAAAFLDAGLVDELAIFTAPIMLGGGRQAIMSDMPMPLSHAHGRWQLRRRVTLSPDILSIYRAVAME